MSRRATTRAVLAAAAAVLTAALLMTHGGTHAYTAKLRLDNAGGLRSGSPVVVGGLPVGVVRLHAHRDEVEVSLEIDRKYAPIGKDATAAIVAQNVLGQKQVRITLGSKANPAPGGYVIPASQVSETTDLDQLLSTLDPDTRTRLAILLNEAGAAFIGREVDFNSFARDFAPALKDGGRLLGQLTSDNQALGKLVTVTDRYLGVLAADRKGLGKALDRIAETTETVAIKRERLRQALRRAPSALTTARSFLAELRRTTSPLGVTARRLAATAPPLSSALVRIEGFRRDAAPALRTAVQVAPALTRLGREATPVIRRALPPLEGLRELSARTIPTIGSTLDRSMDNVLATVENWSRAVQFSDQLGHVFRGEASFAPDAIQSAIRRLTRTLEKRSNARATKRRPRQATQGPAKPVTQRPSPALKDAVPRVVGDVLHHLPPGVQKLVDPRPAARDRPRSKLLLDYLLGP